MKTAHRTIDTLTVLTRSDAETITPAFSTRHARLIRWFVSIKIKLCSCKQKSHYIWGESGKQVKGKCLFLDSECSWGVLHACQRDTAAAMWHGCLATCTPSRWPAACFTISEPLFRKLQEAEWNLMAFPKCLWSWSIKTFRTRKTRIL